MNEVKIVTTHLYPPIPIRDFDWCATTSEYDGEGCPIGFGRTEEAAIEDLREQLEQEAEQEDE